VQANRAGSSITVLADWRIRKGKVITAERKDNPGDTEAWLLENLDQDVNEVNGAISGLEQLGTGAATKNVTFVR
jgi:hypothetical protein